MKIGKGNAIVYAVLAVVIANLLMSNHRLRVYADREFDRGYESAAKIFTDWHKGFNDGWDAGVRYVEERYGNG